jgi:hypothetical protein
MYLVVQDFYVQNQVVIDAVAARTTAFAQLKANIDLINKEIGLQSTNTTGVAQDKSALRDALDEITATTLASAKAWAKAIGNNTLAAEFDYSLSDIQRIKDDTMQGFCEYRIGLVNDNLVALADYGIDATTVTAWQDALNAYTPVLESPRQAINNRVLHTQNLKTIFTDTGKLFTEQLDPLMMVFKSTDPNIYSAYKQARIVIDRKGPGGGTDPNPPVDAKLSGIITDGATLTPLFEVSVTLTPSAANATPITVLTKANGQYLFSNLTPGDFGLLAEKPGYDSVSNPVTLGSGQSAVLDFQMVPMP